MDLSNFGTVVLNGGTFAPYIYNNSATTTVNTGGTLSADIINDSGTSGVAAQLIDAGGTISDVGAAVGFFQSAFGGPQIGYASVSNGGTWDNQSSLLVGDTGAGELVISDGVVSIDGEGGGSLGIGDAASGTVEVNAGGILQVTGNLDVGISAGIHGTLSVAGSGSTLSVADAFIVGVAGSAFGTIASGASAKVTSGLTIGAQSSSSGTLTVTDSNTQLSIGGGAAIGASGTGVLNLQSGAELMLNSGSVVIGAALTGKGTVTVSGTIGSGSVAPSLFFGSELVIGNLGTATLAVNGGGTVGSPTTPAGIIEIGAQGGGVGNVSVAGTGSSLDAATLAIGGSGTAAGGTGLLSIGSGATVVASNAATVWAGGTIVLAGGNLATDAITLDGKATGFGTIGGAITDDGTITAQGGTLTLSDALAGTGTLAFAGLATLVLDQPGTVLTLPVTGLATGDVIELAGLSITGAQVTSPGTIAVTTAGPTYRLTDVSFAPGALETFQIGHDTVTGNDYIQVGCFAAGTRIAGPSSEVPVEALRVGDSVALAGGGEAELVWIGCRTVDATRHPRPHQVWPIRISAGAFGPGLPHRDLFLSPDHAVFVEQVLIPVKHLINGTTIAQVPMDQITYYHLELPRHDVVLAHGLPAESFLDVKDGPNYANRSGSITLRPDSTTRTWEALGCARLVVTGPELQAARALVQSFATQQIAA